jgi:DNA polymerase III subunit epsilon
LSVPRRQSEAALAYRRAELPGPRAPWREVSFSVIDLETNGLDPAVDEIISFAAVTVAGGKVRLDETRYELIRPRRMPGPDTIRIHGLRETDLADAPTLPERIDALLEALTGRVLVAHIAAIETGFLGAALETQGLELRNPVVDTAGLAIELSRLQRRPPPPQDEEGPPGAFVSSPGLGNLARSLGLPVHRPHHADGDALTTAQVFLALATHLEAFSAGTLGSLVRMSRSPKRRPALRDLLHRIGLGVTAA